MKPLLRPLGARLESRYVCPQCIQRLQVRFPSTVARRSAKQGFTYKYAVKLEKAEEEWQHQAAKIREGRQESMFSILEGRGYVHATTEYATPSTHSGDGLMRC